MATFRDSTPRASVLDASGGAPAASWEDGDTITDTDEPERSMGDILAGLRNLTAEQVEKVLQYQRAKVLRLKAVRDEGSVLQRDMENAQRTYDVILQRLTQTSLESQATQSNVNVLTQAVSPIEHASPRVLLNTLLAVVLGSLLAVGTALALELMDRQVRSADDAEEALGLPVLGVMPKPGSKLALGRHGPSLMQQRLLAPLAQPGKGA